MFQTKKEHLPFQRSIFFSLGVSRVQVVLWHCLENTTCDVWDKQIAMQGCPRKLVKG